MLALVDAETRGTIVELGAGWGGLARALARRCPHARVRALEVSLVPFAFAWLVQRARPLANLPIERAHFTTRALDDADVIVAYLWTGGMRALASARLKDGARVVASTFALPEHTPETTVRAKDAYASPVYRYRVAAPRQEAPAARDA
jgi:hypothetical protein